jgi:DNA-binding GntR family transcriptional regulator
MSKLKPAPSGRLVCDHGLRRQAIVASLLADIFEGRLKAGRHLITRELAARFGMSHTPIREALIAMAGLGVIDLQPNRGAVVRQVTARDVHEVCRVRRLLECEATRLACGRLDPAELAVLTEGFRRQGAAASVAPNGDADPHRFVSEARALDSRLHDQIAATCGNAFLAQELSRLKTLFRAFRDVAWAHDEARHDYHRLVEESGEHLAIVEALAAGNDREASLAMARHIMAGARYWGRVLRENRAPTRPVRAPGEPPSRARRRPAGPSQANERPTPGGVGSAEGRS